MILPCVAVFHFWTWVFGEGFLTFLLCTACGGLHGLFVVPWAMALAPSMNWRRLERYRKKTGAAEEEMDVARLFVHYVSALGVVVAVVLILAVVFIIAKESAKQQRNVPMVGQMTCPRCGHVDSYFQTGAHCPNCGHPMT